MYGRTKELRHWRKVEPILVLAYCTLSECDGVGREIRTLDLCIKSALLYHLSYTGKCEKRTGVRLLLFILYHTFHEQCFSQRLFFLQTLYQKIFFAFISPFAYFLCPIFVLKNPKKESICRARYYFELLLSYSTIILQAGTHFIERGVIPLPLGMGI